MLRRIIIFCLAITGICLLVFGVQRWLDQRAAIHVAEQFIESLRTGQQEEALAQVSADWRAEIEQHAKNKKSPLWEPDESLTSRLHHSEINGDTAEVQFWIEKKGFVIKPIFHLQRTETNSWKITRITNLKTDPHWLDAQQKHARATGEETAKELADALENRPGTSVKRDQNSTEKTANK